MSNKEELKNYLSLMEIVRKQGGTEPTNKQSVVSLIEDIAFDIEMADKVVTKRIFNNVETLFGVDSKKAKSIVAEFSKKIDTSVYENTMEIDVYDIEESDIIITDLTESVVNEKARPPKMKGRALKARSAKSEVMKKLNEDPKYMAAKSKLLNIATKLARKYAKDAGINPQLINVDKITVRKETNK